METEKQELKFFRYNDFTFIPVRKFSDGEKDFVGSVLSDKKNDKLLSKNSLFYAGYLESRKPENEQHFEKALKVFAEEDFAKASDSDADIFYCKEKGTFYTSNGNYLVPMESYHSSQKQKIDLFFGKFSKEIKIFKDKNSDYIKAEASDCYNAQLDNELMQNIADVIGDGDVFVRKNENIGEIKVKLGSLYSKKEPDKIQPTGLRHLIKHRMEERLKDGLSVEDARKETTAVLFLAVNNIDKSPAVMEANGRYAVYHKGIKTLIGKDKDGKYVVSGFNYDGTNQEAEDSIGTVIARYGYAPGFLAIYDQVGASLASLGINIPQNSEKSTVQNNEKDRQLSNYEEILFQHAKVNVNGVVRECKNGLVQGFKNAVSKVDGLKKENIELKNENQNLRRIIQNNLETGIER